MSRKDANAALMVKVLSVGGGTLQLEDVKRMQVLLEDGAWLGIHPGHAPLIAATKDGMLRYTQGEDAQEVHVKAGILTLRDNIVSILTTH